MEFEKEKTLVAEYKEILAREESYWRPKSQEVWLNEGDLNTKFFHNTSKIR